MSTNKSKSSKNTENQPKNSGKKNSKGAVANAEDTQKSIENAVSLAMNKHLNQVTLLTNELKKVKKCQDSMKCKIEELQTKNLELKETCRLQQDEIHQLKLLTKKVKILSEASDYALGSLAYLANEYEDFRIKIAESANLAENNQATLIRLDHRTRQIEINQKETATELEQLEQYGRRENLEIHGIPINKEESTNQIVKHVAALLKVDLTNDQISTSHRLIPNHSNSNMDRSKVKKNLPIIVRFANRDKRNEFYSKRHLLKSDSKLNTSRIDIRENLTSFRKSLYKEAKKVKNQLNYNFLWTSQGQIFLRKSPTSRVIRISSLSALDNLQRH